MSHEVHITRGPAFGVGGETPISLGEFQALVERPEIVAGRGPTMARLGGRPLVFHDGLISVTSPGAAELEVLREAALSLGARLFAEDGGELGLSLLAEVQRVVAVGFPDVETTGLTDATASALVAVGDPSFDLNVREAALSTCLALDGAVAVAGLAYLLCRAVESGGNPEVALTCAAAHLLEFRPTLLDGLRKVPTKMWASELEALAVQAKKSPGPFVIQRCSGCAAKNRVPVFAPPDKQPTCGRCKAKL